jgi:sulfur transfer protein SufE
MNTKSPPKNASWWAHETDPSELAQLSTAFSALQRDRHVSGWRRNGLIAVCAVVLVAAIKMLIG